MEYWPVDKDSLLYSGALRQRNTGHGKGISVGKLVAERHGQGRLMRPDAHSTLLQEGTWSSDRFKKGQAGHAP